MKQYEVVNTKSVFFGLTCYELEQYHSETNKESWVKVVLDFANDGTFKEIFTWFKTEELSEY